MPKKVLLPHIEDLLKRYQTAQMKLIDIVNRQTANGSKASYRKSILADVNAEIDLLNQYVTKWTSAYLPMAYENGVDNSYAAFRKANISVGAVAMNAAVLEDIVYQAREQFVEANAYIGRRIADVFRDTGMDVIANKVSTGSTVRQATKDMLQRFARQGVTTITYRNGKIVPMDVYANLVARTTTREATNKGSMDAVQALGYDLVRITKVFTTCEICAVYEGRVYSISGTSPDYPPLSTAFYRGYNTIHPNCNHNIVPYFPEYDDEASKTREDSNKPFTVDPKKAGSIKAYNDDQAVKAERRRDRNEWVKARTLAPNITPPTFSGFRATKRANKDKYKSIKSAMREAGKPPVITI